MWTFATGVLCALVLAGGAYYGLQTGTISVLDRGNDRSTLLEGVWNKSPVVMGAPIEPDKLGW